MIKQLEVIKVWYGERDIREKLLVLGLGIALIYALFSLFLLNPLAEKKNLLTTQMEAANLQIKNWQLQIETLKKIPNTPLYKEWITQSNKLNILKSEYQLYLKESPTKQWENVIKTILATHHNITLVEIKNSPETLYKSNTTSTNKIYQQHLSLTIYSNYFDTISYLQHLEQTLPHIHWEKLTYEVAQYPIAKVQLEFSIIYDKTST